MLNLILCVLILVALAVVMLRIPTRWRNRGKANADGLRKISLTSKTFRPGKGGQLLPTDYYFDRDNFYIVQLEKKTQVPLASISKVEREAIKVNNRSFWIVTYQHNGETKQARFRHNFTLFNTAFADFLDAVQVANPQASVRKFTAFTV